VTRRMPECKKDEGTGEQRRAYNERLQNIYFIHIVVKVSK
jgi:hypothetical protein